MIQNYCLFQYQYCNQIVSVSFNQGDSMMDRKIKLNFVNNNKQYIELCCFYENTRLLSLSLWLKAQLLPGRSGAEEEITTLPYNMGMNVLVFLFKPLCSRLFNLKTPVQL